MNKNEEIASKILKYIGGQEQVSDVTHCATRLRIEIKNEDLINKEELEKIDGVMGYVKSGAQHQFIIGASNVSEVYKAFNKLTNQEFISDNTETEEKNTGKDDMNIVSRLVKIVSDIFVPIIPIVITGGLLMALTAFLTTPGFLSEQSVIEMVPGLEGVVGFLGYLSGIPFTFLPVLIGFTASRKFGGTPLLGATLGLVMVGGALVDPAAVAGVDVGSWDMFGLSVQQVGYHSTVLPIIAATWILSKIEIFGRKHVQNVLNLYVPFISLVITSFITFLLIGPLLRNVGYWLTDGIVWLYSTTGVIGGFVLGLLYAPFVVGGFHHSFIPIETQLVAEIANTGGTFILPIAAMSNVAIGTSALAVAYIYKNNKQLKSEAISAGITSIIGVSEPALFGINLKYRFAFIGALTGSAIASGFVAFVDLKAISMGAGGLLGYLCYAPEDLLTYTVGMLLSFVSTFIFTNIYYRFFERASNNISVSENEKGKYVE